MRIVTNEKLIKRNARIGQITSVVGLVILIAGVIINFRDPTQVGLSLGALLIGFALSQIGIYFGNRYARPPRADVVLSQALKGLDKRYTIYHYTAPISHLLIGPGGFWVILPRHQKGVISYKQGKWQQKGNMWLTYMKWFGQENIGRPDLEANSEVVTLTRYLKKEFPEMAFPDPHPVLVFLNPDAQLENLENAPVPTLSLKKLKDHVKKQAKEKQNRLSDAQLNALQVAIEGLVEGEKVEVAEGDET
ncbi:MAG: hypothetical protein HUU38_07365 [Anaerolineales bacterium]|nr:hypothetical protein [Anaerolineales bacterium]